MPEPDRDLAQQLLTARETAKLTQDQLAAKLGISRVQVGRIESGKRGTYAAMVRKWFAACGYTMDSVALGDSSRTGELVDALGAISDEDLDLVLRLMRVLPTMPRLGRRMLTDIVEAHEPQP